MKTYEENCRYKGIIWMIVEAINFLILFWIMVIRKEEVVWIPLVLTVGILIFAFGSMFYKLCYMFSILIHFGILIFIWGRTGQQFFMSCLWIASKTPCFIPEILLFIWNILIGIRYLFINKYKNVSETKMKEDLAGHLIVALASLICIIIFSVVINLPHKVNIIKDDEIIYSQSLLDEYEKLELTSYQVEKVYVNSDNLDKKMDGAIVISFKTINEGNPYADKEAIIRCTDEFMKMNPDNELNQNKLAIFFQEDEGPMYTKEAFFENGVLVMKDF